ncbi:MAG: hypothetical protein AAF798_01225 [Bacteroidota bacterium]
MTKFLFTICLSLFSIAAFAQQQAVDARVVKDTEAMVKYYDLDETQAQKMEVIQARKYRNLADIASLEQSDRTLYLRKLKSIRTGTWASTRRILREDQMQPYNDLLIERRRKESAFIKEQKATGKTKAEIELALLELEVE